MHLQDENSMALAMQIATLICCWDKDFSSDEVTVLLNEINEWSELEGSWDHKLHKQLTCAMHDAIDCIVELDDEDLNEFIAQSAARMTNHQGRKITLRLAYRAAAADGLDEEEINGLMHFGSHHWGMTQDEISEAAIPGEAQNESSEAAPSSLPNTKFSEDSIQQVLNEFMNLKEGFFIYMISSQQNVYAQCHGSPGSGDEEFEVEITGPEFVGDPEVISDNVMAQLQELGWENDGVNFTCTMSRDQMMDGFVADLLFQSFNTYDLLESDIDCPGNTVTES